MRAVALAIVCVVGCSDDDFSGAERGMVTIVTEPGARVDFMSAAADVVVTSEIADASGSVSTVVNHGDRAVIVSAQQTLYPPIAVLDELIPEQVYRWYFTKPQPVTTPVVVSWPAAETNSGYYIVHSRCSGVAGNFVSITLQVCADGDAVLVIALDPIGNLASAAYQVVSGPTANQQIAVTQPFEPYREVTFNLAGLSGIRRTFYSRDGVAYRESVDVQHETWARYPDLDAMLRIESTLSGSKELIDQRPIRDTVTLGAADRPMPELASRATFQPDTGFYEWEVVGDGVPDAAAIELRTTNGNALTLVAPYRGARLHVPTLPADLTEIAVPSEGIPSMLASPGGIAAAVSGYGQRNDPMRPTLQLYTSGASPTD